MKNPIKKTALPKPSFGPKTDRKRGSLIRVTVLLYPDQFALVSKIGISKTIRDAIDKAY